MSVEALFEWLFREWKRLPPWLRNLTYLSVLVVALYLLLSPGYLDGSLRTIAPDGSESTFLERGQIELDTQGRRIIVGLDENGDWHVPLASRLPFKSQPIGVRFQGRLYPVQIPYLAIVCGERVVVTYTEVGRPPFAIQDIADRNCGLLGAVVGFTRGAKAAELTAAPTPLQSSVDDLLASLPGSRPLSDVEQHKLAGAIERELHVEVTRSAWQIASERNDFRSLILNSARPTLPRTFGVTIQNIMKAYLPERDLYVGPDIPASKLRSALGARSDETPPERSVIALLDGTVFGSASVHLLFTAQGVYFRTSALRSSGPREGFVDFQAFPRLKFDKVAWQEVGIGNGSFDTSGSSISSGKLIQILNDIKTAVLTQPNSSGGTS